MKSLGTGCFQFRVTCVAFKDDFGMSDSYTTMISAK